MLAGHLLVWYTWHSIFWLLVGIGLLMLVAVLVLPETHPVEKRSKKSIGHTYNNYWILLRNKGFMKYTLCVSSFYIAIYAFLTGSPYVYIDVYEVQMCIRDRIKASACSGLSRILPNRRIPF